MTKLNFLIALNEKLSGLPREEAEERLRFYSEMIEDRMEEGLTEEEAVAAVGDIGETAAHITADLPVKTGEKPKTRMKAWEIVLLVLGAPIWFSLLIAAASVAISVYAVLWSVVIALWAVFGALVGSAVGVPMAGIIVICTGHTLSGTAMIGGALVCAGLAILFFYGCAAATKGVVWMTKKCILRIKNGFAGKEAAR